jgi:hypothetical protein
VGQLLYTVVGKRWAVLLLDSAIILTPGVRFWKEIEESAGTNVMESNHEVCWPVSGLSGDLLA